MAKGEMRPNVQLVAYPVVGIRSRGYVSMTYPLTVVAQSQAREVLWCRDAHATLAAVKEFGEAVARANPGRSFVVSVRPVAGQRAPSGFRKREAALGASGWGGERWLVAYEAEEEAPADRYAPLAEPGAVARVTEALIERAIGAVPVCDPQLA